MEGFLLSVHVLAGILFVGGSAVAASLFPRYVPVVAGDGASSRRPELEARRAGERDERVARVLHRVTRVYGILGLAVPAAGITLALWQGRMTEIWVLIAMVLTAVAGALLAFQIYPRQRDALAGPGPRAELRTLAMLVGVYNLLWVVVVVLMIVRPGSAE